MTDSRDGGETNGDAGDWDDVEPTDTDRFAADPEKAAFLRDIAEEVRGDSSQSEQVAAFLYRVSDLYDPDEDTDPKHIYVNMREILRVKERGGMDG